MSKSISRRFSDLSYGQAEFDKATPIYNEPFKSSGFLQSLPYIKPKQHSKKNRPRNIIWLSPLFRKTVKTNVGKQFLSLIGKHFTVNNPLRRIFNRGTIKVNYSCMQNMKCIINNHNSKIQRNTEAPEKNCSCRVKPNCPLDGACLTRNLVYKATVLPESQEPKTYIGMTEGETCIKHSAF